MGKILIFTMICIHLFTSNEIIDKTLIICFVIYLLYQIISGIVFSKKTFMCLNCGYNFKSKWYILTLIPWRARRRYRAYKELSIGTCEKINYKCPECKVRDCVMNDTLKW